MTNSIPSGPTAPPPPSYYDRLMEAVNAGRNALKGKEVRWNTEHGEFVIVFNKMDEIGLGFDMDGDGKFERQLILPEKGPYYFIPDAVGDPRNIVPTQSGAQSVTLFNSIYKAGDDQLFSVPEQEALTPMAARLMNIPPRNSEPGSR